MSNTSKTGSRKTTFVLSAILVLLVLFALTVFVIIPAYNHYYITHIQYPVYGGMTEELKDSEFYEDMQSGKSFCFLGDSITAGNEINGITWYQPLIPYTKGKISNFSCGGWMSGNLYEKADEIPVADIYVIAIGVNDIMRPDSKYASNPIEFTTVLREITRILKSKSHEAKFYYIAPWTFHNQDDVSTLRAKRFRSTLVSWCNENGYICINPNPVLVSIYKEKGTEDFMKDDFHPNAPNGVGLYSYAVLKADHDRRVSSSK